MMKEKSIIVRSNLNILNSNLKINKFIIYTVIMNKKNLLSWILFKVNANLQTYSKIQI